MNSNSFSIFLRGLVRIIPTSRNLFQISRLLKAVNSRYEKYIPNGFFNTMYIVSLQNYVFSDFISLPTPFQ